ncbi:unnamed protein product [Gongylonema pulchrum]|uniref:Transcriptional regulator n=1 Tax=Gongylonema pulchrum TaxID=637853 RepID=A0A183DEQ5_9BILA|nr:unnamed protein product [Gongylonema pulchrum]
MTEAGIIRAHIDKELGMVYFDQVRVCCLIFF